MQFTSSNLSSNVRNTTKKGQTQTVIQHHNENSFKVLFEVKSSVKLLTKMVTSFSPKPKLPRNIRLVFDFLCCATQHTKMFLFLRTCTFSWSSSVWYPKRKKKEMKCHFFFYLCVYVHACVLCLLSANSIAEKQFKSLFLSST